MLRSNTRNRLKLPTMTRTNAIDSRAYRAYAAPAVTYSLPDNIENRNRQVGPEETLFEKAYI